MWGLSSTGYAGYFTGNVHYTGTLSGPVRLSKVDSPLDPANQYLTHAGVESSEMKNIYDGTVVLDDKGEAVVILPKWFQVYNNDFRYQLTAIGRAAPGLYVAEKIANDQFKIAGGLPGMEVSWQVTGVRQDAYAKAHPIVVEQDKPAQERGYYQNPDLFGQPEGKSIEVAHGKLKQGQDIKSAQPPSSP